MRFPRHYKKARLPFTGFAVLLFFLAYCPAGADAKQRHAFVVGIGDYENKSGLPALAAPANDAEDLKTALERLPQPFNVAILTNDQAKDKETFQAAFDSFLSRIEPGDDVLFYFSGHGFSAEKKNFYLLKSAKSDTAFIKDLGSADQRELDTADKKARKYRDWIGTVALSEEAIEKAVADRKPNVIILIADACRSPVEGAKGAVLEGVGVVLPGHSAFGTYRLYSASAGQVSYDSLEAIPRSDSGSGYRPREDKKTSKEKEKKNSLFTRVLIPEILVPGQPILIMAAQVKRKVREQAQNINKDQIPDYSEDPRSNDYFFWPSEGDTEIVALCQPATIKLENLRSGIASGALGRDTIDQMEAELSRCGPVIRDELRSLRQIEAQGTGSFANRGEQTVDASNLTDPQQICEVKGSSPLDSDRPQGLSGIDIQQLAAAAISGEKDRVKSTREIKSIVEACEEVVKQRPRVARFKFNAGMGNYALATMSSNIERNISLRKASFFFEQAADLGYAAAYNNLAVMIENGEFYKDQNETPEPPDRERAATLLERGSNLNHVVAQYNLGMAYLKGDLGLGSRAKLNALGNVSEKLVEQKREAAAFKYLSAASERSYVPAMIETAKLLHDGKGVTDANPERAIELLEVAASTGSWEAMFWLGEIYRRGKVQVLDHQRAILWYARAAEAGDIRSQEKLAEMLTKGDGVPAPQPEAAGRYYRLAAYAGSRFAQGELGDLLRDRKIPFRPPVGDHKPDGGALEIRTLYLAAFASGNPRAGLQLAKLYRAGFPSEQGGSEAIPKDPESAVDMLYKTIERVKQAAPDSEEADPRVAAWAAFELVSMYDKSEAKRRDGSSILTDDQIQQLRQEFGDGGNQGYIKIGAIGTPACGSVTANVEDRWLMVWDWSRDEPPTEPQLRWLEHYYHCSEKEIRQAKESGKREPKPEDTGFTREFRNKIERQYKAAREDAQKNGAKAKSFYDRMAELVSRSDGGGRRRRRY